MTKHFKTILITWLLGTFLVVLQVYAKEVMEIIIIALVSCMFGTWIMSEVDRNDR